MKDEGTFRHMGGGPKGLFLLLRYVFIVSAAYLVLSYWPGLAVAPFTPVMIAVALGSNVLLGRLPPERLFSWYVEAPVLVADTLWVSWSLHTVGVSGQEFFLLYFFVLFLAAIGESVEMVVLGTTVVSAANMYFMAESSILSGPHLLRIVFFFTVALFYGHVITQMRHERERADKGFGLARELEAMVAERTDQLQRLYDQAVTANDLKSEFMANMSHELRTPLHIIIGHTHMLADREHGLSADGLALNQRTRDVATHLLRLVDGVLDLGRLEAGKVPVTVQPTPLGRLLESLRSRDRMPPRPGVALAWEVPADLPVIETDTDKLSIVVENLIGNALKFTVAGSVTVRARDRRSERLIEIEVADTGPGIPEHQVVLIFEPFCQVDGVASKADGFGLGLAIVQRYAALLGGTVAIESRVGQGTTFRLQLPYVIESRETPAEDGAPAAPASRRRVPSAA